MNIVIISYNVVCNNPPISPPFPSLHDYFLLPITHTHSSASISVCHSILYHVTFMLFPKSNSKLMPKHCNRTYKKQQRQKLIIKNQICKLTPKQSKVQQSTVKEPKREEENINKENTTNYQIYLMILLIGC